MPPRIARGVPARSLSFPYRDAHQAEARRTQAQARVEARAIIVDELLASARSSQHLPIHLVYAYEGDVDEAKERYLAERAEVLTKSGLTVTSSRARGR